MFVNVLVTAVGGIVGEGIVKSLKLANMSDSTSLKYRIYGADMNERAAGLYRCDCGILVPPASDPGYIASIKLKRILGPYTSVQILNWCL